MSRQRPTPWPMFVVGERVELLDGSAGRAGVIVQALPSGRLLVRTDATGTARPCDPGSLRRRRNDLSEQKA